MKVNAASAASLPRRLMKRADLFPLAGWLLALGAIIGFVFYYGHTFGVWGGFPKGGDAYNHLTRIKYWLDFFPNVSWQYHWGNGMFFYRIYAPFFHILAALMVKLFGVSPEGSVSALGFLSFVLVGLGIFGYVKVTTNNFLAAITAAVLALSSFRLWDPVAAGGIYSRFFALGLLLVAFWLTAWLIKLLSSSPEKPYRLLHFGVIGVLLLVLLSHVLIAVFAWIGVGLMIWLAGWSFQERIATGLRIFVPLLGLGAFYILPMLFGGVSNVERVTEAVNVKPAPLVLLYDFDGLGPLIVPAFLLALMAIWWGKLGEKKYFLPPLILAVYFSLYTFGDLKLPGLQPFWGVSPQQGLSFMVPFMAITVGVILGTLSDKGRAGKVLMVALCIVLIGGGLGLVPATRAALAGHASGLVIDTACPDCAGKGARELFVFDDKADFQHRFASGDSGHAVWFNYVYQIPQVRDYYAQGVLFPDWRAWFEHSVWNPEEFSLEEAKMALDWFAVKWFVVPRVPPTPEATSLQYLRDPDFELVAHNDDLHQFKLVSPAPILQATNTETVLVLGAPVSHEILIRNLSLLNYNSQKAIPLMGREFVDSYSLEELEHFDALFLYNYQYRSKEKAFELLSSYVREGGTIFWETHGSPDEAGDLPELAPVSRVERGSLDDTWDLDPEGAIGQDVNVEDFNEASYEGGPWGISAAKEADLRGWARPILIQGDQVLLASGEYGQGRVIWSGFNFPYHISYGRKNLQEAKLFQQALQWLFGEESRPDPSYQAEFVNPEKRMVTLHSGAKGVLFKESYFPQWKARFVTEEGQQSLPIYQAGPGMMYVPLDGESPGMVLFEYNLAWFEVGGWIITFLSGLALLSYALVAASRNRRRGL